MGTQLMEATAVLGALAKPVMVQDPDNMTEVMTALLSAWQTRVPGFSSEITVPISSVELMLFSITVEWWASSEAETTSHAVRTAAVALTDDTDVNQAYILGFLRASRMWGMEVQAESPVDREARRILAEMTDAGQE